METDNQHLDFLISQYVDGCLEGADKKLVEQKMLVDPAARKLYAEHRETQDLLDDWGSRIPMINWEEFEQKLEGRLEVEAAERERVSMWRRRMKPWAVAAGLMLAVGLGYAWHGLSQGTIGGGPGPDRLMPANARGTRVEFLDMQAARAPSHSGLQIVEDGSAGQRVPVAQRAMPEISAPADAVAYESLRANVEYGMNHLAESVRPDGLRPTENVPAVSSAVAAAPAAARKEDGETPK